MAQDSFHGLLSALADALGCGSLPPEKDGRVLFGLDGKMGVVIERADPDEAGRDCLVVSILVGRPDTSDADLLKDLLMGNYMWSASGEGTLAIDRGTGILVVQRLFETAAPPEEFVDVFASMAGAARYWQPRLQAATPDDSVFPAEFYSLRV